MKLTEMVILAYPDPNQDYELYTNASDQSIVPLVYDHKEKKEVEKPIYFLSHK